MLPTEVQVLMQEFVFIYDAFVIFPTILWVEIVA